MLGFEYERTVYVDDVMCGCTYSRIRMGLGTGEHAAPRVAPPLSACTAAPAMAPAAAACTGRCLLHRRGRAHAAAGIMHASHAPPCCCCCFAPPGAAASLHGAQLAGRDGAQETLVQ